MASSAPVKISYIVPVYNGAVFINRCVDSILSQKFSDIEVILVDDGSTDGSAGILHDIENTHSRCRVISQENMGCGAARNTAIRHAKGEFIAILDVDDIAVGERSKLQYDAAISSDSDLVVGGSNIVDLQRNKIGIYTPSTKPHKLYRALVNRKASFHHSSCLMRTAKVISLGAYCERLRLGGDLDLFYRLFEAGKVSAVSDVIVEHTRHEASISNGVSIEESLFIGVFVTACHLLRVHRNIFITSLEETQYRAILECAREWFEQSRSLAEFRFRQRLKISRQGGTLELLKAGAASPLKSTSSVYTYFRGDKSSGPLADHLYHSELLYGLPVDQD